MSGSPKIEKKISQSVPVNADAGDVLVIGGKAAAYARMGCEFSITADIYSTATEKEEPTIQVDFDPSISMIHQTTATYYTLTTPCHHIVYSFVYDDQVTAYLLPMRLSMWGIMESIMSMMVMGK